MLFGLDFIDILNNTLFSELAWMIVAFSVVTLCYVLKLVIYKKFDILPLLALIIICALGCLFHEYLVVKIIVVVLCMALAGYMVYDFYFVCKCYQVLNKKTSEYSSNATCDYYFRTDAKDRITDASKSYVALINKNIQEVKKLKGFQTMMTELDIISVNGKEINEEVALTLLYDYEQTLSKIKTYRFTMEVKEEGYIVIYCGIIQPLYYGRKFLGRNVFLSKDRTSIIDSLREALDDATNRIVNDREQTYTLMSLSDQVIMYYDFNTRTYVATEAFKTFMNLEKKELTIEEFISKIHPDDVNGYEEQGSNINSISVTRMRIRMKFNDEYYIVYDDSIYLQKDSGLVSVIRLVNPNPTNNQNNTTVVSEYTNTDGDDLVNFELSKVHTTYKEVIEILNTISKDEGE